MIVVISIDGVCHEDVDFKILPNLKALADQGVYTKRLRTVFPSVTWGIHTSVITGKIPGKHGIWGNEVYSHAKKTGFAHFDTSKVDINAVQQPTIFEKAAAKGKILAAICWPLSQGSPHIKYNIPECYNQDDFDNYSTPELKTELLANGMEFGSYADWSIDKKLGPLQDDLTCRITEYLIAHKQIDVLFTHFLIHDSYQHLYGINTTETVWSLKYADSLVGRILNSLMSANLLEKSHIIIMSDHGHEAINKFFDITSFLKQQGICENSFKYSNNSGTLFLYFKQDKVSESTFIDLCAALEKHEAVEFTCLKEHATKFGFNPQLNLDTFPDIIIGMNSGWVINDMRGYKGAHGYFPETHPRMDSFMIRSGKSFLKGAKEELGDICDIFNIVEKLLDK